MDIELKALDFLKKIPVFFEVYHRNSDVTAMLNREVCRKFLLRF